MGLGEHTLVTGTVMHGRLLPRRNHFSYKIYYLALSLSRLDDLPMARNRLALMSFYDRDHGRCDGSDLEVWARDILRDHGLSVADGEITLLCMPRILGYVFNPVSFWLCHDRDGALRAVLCEVHNTFGERHTYICAHDDHRPIGHDDVLSGEKLFHVSPFLPREGHYTFRFDLRDQGFKVWIDYFNAENQKQLVTALRGDMRPMNKPALRTAFWGHPLVTFKAIILIHWQAMKLVFKGIRYIKRPQQHDTKTSTARKLKKM